MKEKRDSLRNVRKLTLRLMKIDEIWVDSVSGVDVNYQTNVVMLLQAERDKDVAVDVDGDWTGLLRTTCQTVARSSRVPH